MKTTYQEMRNSAVLTPEEARKAVGMPTLPERESRFLSASVEIRAAAETKSPTVFGYAAKFNVRSENLGNADWQFYEVLMPGCFDEVLQDDVRALFNHDPSLILARSKGGEGSLKIGVDQVGLYYEFEPPDTQAGRDLLISLQRGDVDQSSFSFTVSKDGQNWEETREGDGPVIATRTINKVKRLYDVSPVTYPAYPDATVALRSFQEFRQDDQSSESDESKSSQEEESLIAWAAFDGLITPPELIND